MLENQQINTNKVEIIPKTYKLKKENVENFKNACQICGLSQSQQLDTLIEEFLDLFNSHFKSEIFNDSVEIKTVEDLINYLQEFPYNMRVKLVSHGNMFEIDKYTLKNCVLQFGSQVIDDLLENSIMKLKETKDVLEDLASCL